tara:strand:- start:2209 stop:2406 length:198 start_codon:yes stop_codon:yes gene_type:complete
MEKKKERKKLAVSVGTNVFFYQGEILDEEDGFIKIFDKREGILSINKDFIISIKNIDNGEKESIK